MSLERQLRLLWRQRRVRWGLVLLVGVFTLVYLKSDRKPSPVEETQIDPSDDVADSVQTDFRDGTLGNYEPTEAETKSGPGEHGEAVSLSSSEKDKVHQAVQEFGFNTVVSDKISLDRSIPDTRAKECKYWHYPKKLPSASVVIVFHNEAFTPLMRTVHSVINRSPKELLHEVLLVDDFSTKKHLKQKLEDYIERFDGKVRLIRNTKREGLIGSRSLGGMNSKGEVVVFLDAHCEANVNWLPPLLAPIAKNRLTVTVPVIDSIDMNTWAYHPQYGYRGDELFRGIFEWGLLYKESEIPDDQKKRRKQISEPFDSPTHAGGLFAIERKWFEKLGWYDPGLQIWGGENFELSFKVWQCGGRVVNVPCSRVGHVYRNHMPYSFGNLTGPIISTNYKRVAEVWMDEYKEYYYRREPFMRARPTGDISKQVALRESLNCKPFKWYVEKVAYDIIPQYPLPPANIGWGEVITEATGLCVDTLGHSVPGMLGISSCHHQGGNQLFRINEAGQFSCGEWCITAKGNRLETGRCVKGSSEGPWNYSKETKLFKLKSSGHCLTANIDRTTLELAPCQDDLDRQKWTLKPVDI